MATKKSRRPQLFSPVNRLTKCRCCKKMTHTSIDGCQDIRLCRVCLDSADLENSHSDGRHTPGTYGTGWLGGCPENCPIRRGLECNHEDGGTA